MSTLTDKCTDLILDFIAGGVQGNRIGESKGNYNAVIGNADATEDLSRYTIDQIIEMGLARKRAGEPSTAMGRYQFLTTTLQSLLGTTWTLTTKFTPAVQDRLAVELLVRRGYSSWWRGQLTDHDFAHNLSMEWASLPDPENDGKSHYDGDSAGNHASTTLDAVYAMLKHARTLMPSDQGTVTTEGTVSAPPPVVTPPRIEPSLAPLSDAQKLTLALQVLDARIATLQAARNALALAQSAI
jgi:conjugal transfer mating pair stabilization protein TraG